MQKIPTLFVRGADHLILPEIAPGCDWVRMGRGEMTMKVDGLNVMIKHNLTSHLPVLHKRLRPIGDETEGAYEICSSSNPQDDPFFEAFGRLILKDDGIYECIGPKILGNPHKVPHHMLIKIRPVKASLVPFGIDHTIRRGSNVTAQELFNSIRRELADPACDVEGLVFHLEDYRPENCRMAKVKKKDFGLAWPSRQTPPPTTGIESTIDKTCMSCGVLGVAERDGLCSDCTAFFTK